jgi:hypothetical protein
VHLQVGARKKRCLASVAIPPQIMEHCTAICRQLQKLSLPSAMPALQKSLPSAAHEIACSSAFCPTLCVSGRERLRTARSSCPPKPLVNVSPCDHRGSRKAYGIRATGDGGSEVQTSQRTTSDDAEGRQVNTNSVATSADEDEDEGISDADVQASMAAAAGLLGATDTSSTWSMKDEVPGLTDEPVYVLKQEKPKKKPPGEVIFDLLFLLGGLLDRPFEDGAQAMEASAGVVIERVEEEMSRARAEGVSNEKVTELARYVNLLAMDMKMVGAARKYETLVARCKTAQEKVKGALQRAEALDK